MTKMIVIPIEALAERRNLAILYSHSMGDFLTSQNCAQNTERKYLNSILLPY